MGIDAIELAHTLRQIAIRDFQEKVLAVIHLTVGVDDPVKAFADSPQEIKPLFTVYVFEVDSLLPDIP